MKVTRIATFVTLATLALSASRARAADGQNAPAPDKPRPVRVTIYPILIQAPIFGAEIDLPSVPVPPGSGGAGEAGAVGNKTDVSFNAAYMAGLAIESDRLFVEGNGTWAAVSADRETPRVRVKSDTLLFNVRGGVRLVGGLFVTGGVRRIVDDLDATVTVPSTGAQIEGHAKPGIWDPMIGADYRFRTSRVDVTLVGQGGGFGVGADVDASGEIRVDVRPVKFLDLRVGYQFLYYKLTVANVSIGRFQRDLVSKQTLHGPSVGIGIVF